MDRAGVLMLVVAMVALQVSESVGSEINLDVTPSSLQPVLTDTMTLRCSLDDTSGAGLVGRSVDRTSEDVHYVMSILVTRNGADVASITTHIPARAMADVANVHVTGSIGNAPGDRGYIELTWRYPTSAQAGTYGCNITGLNDAGHTILFTKTVELEAISPTIDDLVRQIHKMQLKSDADDAKMAQMSHIENGTLEFHNPARWSNTNTYTETGEGWTGPMRYQDQTVKFDQPYVRPPVVTWDQNFIYVYHQHLLYSVRLVKVDKYGFTIRVGKFRDSTNYDFQRLDLNWKSFPVL